MEKMLLGYRYMLYLHYLRPSGLVIRGNGTAVSLLAIMMHDLLLNNYISLVSKKIQVTSTSPAPAQAYGLMLKKIEASHKNRRALYWLKQLNIRNSRYFKSLKAGLMQQQRLQKQKKHFLFIPYTVYRLTQAHTVKKDLAQWLQRVQYPRQATDEDKLLLCALKNSQLLRKVVPDKTKRKPLLQVCKTFEEQNWLANDLRKAIRQLNAAMAAASS